MNPDSGLILPSLVPVESQGLILPPGERKAIADERAAMLAAIEAEEAERLDDDEEYDQPEPELSERVRKTVCAKCGHLKLCFMPARLCEKCLRKAAGGAGIPFPEGGGQVTLNRAQRRAARRK